MVSLYMSWVAVLGPVCIMNVRAQSDCDHFVWQEDRARWNHDEAFYNAIDKEDCASEYV